MNLDPGSQVGPYTMTAVLGHTGMGVVYKAQDPSLGRQVAVKVLLADLSLDRNGGSPGSQGRISSPPTAPAASATETNTPTMLPFI